MKTRERWGIWAALARSLWRQQAAKLPPEVAAIADGRKRFAAAVDHLGLTEADLAARQRVARHHALVLAAATILALASAPWSGWWAAVAVPWLAIEALLSAHRHYCLRTRRYAGIRHFLARPGEWWPR